MVLEATGEHDQVEARRHPAQAPDQLLDDGGN
jgi:hypothetical protein